MVALGVCIPTLLIRKTLSDSSSDLISFDTNGFTLRTKQSVWGNVAIVGIDVAWCWDAGDTTVTNNDGSIRSQVRASQEAGFSVATYTGATGSQSFGHGLSSAPKLIHYQRSAPIQHLGLRWWIPGELTIAMDTSMKLMHLAMQQPQSVSSSTVTLGNNNLWFGANGDDYVAYCWSEVPGFSSISSYTGTGIESGPMVDCGFKPAYVMVKRTDSAGDSWFVFDTKRDIGNPVNVRLYANDARAEETNIDALEILSNGFRVITSDTSWNASGGTYITWRLLRTQLSALTRLLLTLLPTSHNTWDRKQYNFAPGDQVKQNADIDVNTGEVTGVTDNSDGTQTLEFADSNSFGALEVGDVLKQSFTPSATISSVSASTEGGYTHGLRFDNDRKTKLSRNIDLAPTDCTVSAWLKQTDNSVYKSIVEGDNFQLLQDSGGFSARTLVIVDISLTLVFLLIRMSGLILSPNSQLKK